MRICLIGATHPSYNPRLIREADTLADAGHDVRVIAPCFMTDLEERDRRLLESRKWRFERIDYRQTLWRPRIRSLTIRGRRKLASILYRQVKTRWLAEYSYTASLPELTVLASREQADWFIAHAHAALPVAAAAAKRWGTRLGFDCEDLLSELGIDPRDIVRGIEQQYLPLCDYVSVPSQAIAEYLLSNYAVHKLIVLYNVFPLKLATGLSRPAERVPSEVLKLHWFGQTIGLGRGIEDVIEAMGLIGPGVELHLRGRLECGFRAIIDALAERLGVTPQMFFYPALDHDRLIESLGAFDVGLALERPENGSYSRTVTNKLFSFLLAGLAVAATDTPGQKEILVQIPSAGFLYPANNPQALADGLRQWKEDSAKLLNAKEVSWQTARNRFNWDTEAARLLQTLDAPKTLMHNPITS